MSDGRFWREAFKKYVKIVEWAEGVTFLHQSNWTEEEWPEIQQAVEEAYREGESAL